MQKTLRMENRTRRWREQGWLLDSVIKTVGPEWDQGRLGSKGGRAGSAGLSAFRRAGARMRKFDDIGPQFGREGMRMEGIARDYEDQGRPVSAAENYFIASLLYASAQWPYFDINDEDLEWERRMIETYDRFIEFAPHPIERVDIPYRDTALSAFLHLPGPAGGGPFPCVLHIGGMDGSKENMVALHGDAALARGMAVLALDGPGQGETRNRGVTISSDNFAEAAERGFLARGAARDRRRENRHPGLKLRHLLRHGRGCRVEGQDQGLLRHRRLPEPGCDTIFNAASPTFKVRFMFMAGYEDEDAFDEFRQEFDLRKVAKDISAPYMIVAGEADQLSPIQHTYDLFELIEAPKRLVVYQDANHSMAAASSRRARRGARQPCL